MTEEQSPRAGDELAAKTRIHAVYLQLRRDILDGKFRPGARLPVEHLKAGYGVSAGTVREALSLLVADALVTPEGQRGFWVTPVSEDDLTDITNTRMQLESLALRQAIRLGDDAWEAAIVAAFHRLGLIEDGAGQPLEGRLDEWEHRNQEFHDALIAACPSRWLKRFRGILYHQHERYRRLSLWLGSAERNVHAEHEAILSAVLRREEDKACELMERHIAQTRDMLLRSGLTGSGWLDAAGLTSARTTSAR
ncbi:MAG: FCD domain-containing protein [Hyphomicrobium sp.]|nr:FCD domain-containing protein [Hyphomicrobium sp.]